MTEWNIQQMRDAVERKGAFCIGGDFGAHCDYLALPETDREGWPSQQDMDPPPGVIVDIQTANLLVTVYDALNDKNKAKFVSLSLERAVDVAWKAVA